jgi:tetratricopeptide (TPR) repeat protein
MVTAQLTGTDFVLLVALLGTSIAPETQFAADQRDFSTLSLQLSPAVCIPIADSSSRFGLGGGGAFSAEWRLPSFPLAFLRADLQYVFSPLVTGEHSISVLSAAAGGGLRIDLAPWFFVSAFVTGGYYYGFLNDPAGGLTGGGNPILSAGGGLSFLLTSSFSVGLGAAYENDFGLNSGIRVFLGTSLHVPFLGVLTPRLQALPERPEPLETLSITEVKFESVFPVFYKYYDDHRVGGATLTNGGDTRMTDLVVSFSVQKYMDSPKVCARLPALEAGETKEVELFALFNDRVLEITEATKLAAEISVSYALGGARRDQRTSETIRVYNRNAMSWDDDRRVCAFVSATDPAVMSFSKNVAGIVKGRTNALVNANLLFAFALHEALTLHGLSYVRDPETPYLELSRKKTEVDFLQFPRQTLEYKAGDCDDLSILYCALFESVAVEAAFVTVPGHIFVAFSLDMEPEGVKSRFLKAEDFIFRDGKSWVPVEVTERTGGFYRAWSTGAREWRESTESGQAGFFPVRQAWKEYEPVGLAAGELKTPAPDPEKLRKAFDGEVMRFVEREIYPQAERLQKEIQSSGGNLNMTNKLGVLYARYGLTEKARIEFNRILEKEESVATLLNMGNTYFLQDEMEKAAEYFDRAYRKEPENPRVLLSVARVNHETENYGLAARAYGKLKQLSPALASQFTYLEMKRDEATRASEIHQAKGVILWEGE